MTEQAKSVRYTLGRHFTRDDLCKVVTTCACGKGRRSGINGLSWLARVLLQFDSEGKMEPKAVLSYLRQLCVDIDAGRPLKVGFRRVIVPTALGVGIGLSGCGASTPLEPAEEICDNELDDDENGLVDCDDPACEGVEVCWTGDPDCFPRPELCDDMIDNDGDGQTDCADLCCAAYCFNRDCPMCEYGVPFEPPDHETSCVDGLDEDCDGQADCCDPDCVDDPSCADSGK